MRFLLHILMKIEYSQQIFEQYSINNFHSNPSSGNRVVPCGRTDTLACMTNIMVAFRSFVNAAKIQRLISQSSPMKRRLEGNFGLLVYKRPKDDHVIIETCTHKFI